MRDALVGVLDMARDLGFLGPGPVAPHLAHAEGFAAALEQVGATEPSRVADLGSGGGVPALVLALRWPASTWALVEALRRRADFLRQALPTLSLEDRVTVVGVRAEAFGRDARGDFDVVTARGFGPPAVTAECAAPLLRLEGHLVVSEPPGGAPDRWPSNGVAELGLRLVTVLPGPPAFVVLRQVEACPERYPRRTGVPGKRPLF